MNSLRPFITRSGQVSVFVLILLALDVATVRAQSFEAGLHYSMAQWSEFDGNDYGIGGRVTWRPSSMLGLDADITWYPSDFPPDTVVPFSGRRLEGLFGATAGPTIGRIRPFAKAAAGFLAGAETPIAFACVAIFPPPLACVLAGGHTLPAYEIGGGIEMNITGRTFLRVDIADRILKYPGPTFDTNFERRDEGFFGHALRFTIGGGVRF
jgi:hypothetical protein